MTPRIIPVISSCSHAKASKRSVKNSIKLASTSGGMSCPTNTFLSPIVKFISVNFSESVLTV